MHTCEFKISNKKMEPKILVTCIANHTTSLTSCLALNELTWQICHTESSEFMYPVSWHQVSSLNIMNLVSILPSCTPPKYQFTKFSLSHRVCELQSSHMETVSICTLHSLLLRGMESVA
jgi:hypothetical protein